MLKETWRESPHARLPPRIKSRNLLPGGCPQVKALEAIFFFYQKSAVFFVRVHRSPRTREGGSERGGDNLETKSHLVFLFTTQSNQVAEKRLTRRTGCRSPSAPAGNRILIGFRSGGRERDREMEGPGGMARDGRRAGRAGCTIHVLITNFLRRARDRLNQS